MLARTLISWECRCWMRFLDSRCLPPLSFHGSNQCEPKNHHLFSKPYFPWWEVVNEEVPSRQMKCQFWANYGAESIPWYSEAKCICDMICLSKGSVPWAMSTPFLQLELVQIKEGLLGLNLPIFWAAQSCSSPPKQISACPGFHSIDICYKFDVVWPRCF